MTFLKVLVGFFLYFAFGVGFVTLTSRLDENFGEEIEDVGLVLVFGVSLLWPIFAVFEILVVLTKKLTLFWNDLLDKLVDQEEEEEE